MVKKNNIDDSKLASSKKLLSFNKESKWAPFILGAIGYILVGVYVLDIPFFVLLGMGALQVPIGFVIGYLTNKLLIFVLVKVFLIDINDDNIQHIAWLLLIIGPTLVYIIMPPIW